MRLSLFRACCFATALLLTSGCSSAQSLQSQSPATVPTIDAAIDDWLGVLKPVDGQPFSLGVQNDGDFLYLALLSNDPGVVQQIAFQGLVVWFDPTGDNEQAFGLRFPLGISAARRGGEGPRPGTQGAPRRDPDVVAELFNNAPADVEFLNAGARSGVRQAVATIPGIEAKATLEYGTLTYELKIPLQQTDTYGFAVGAAPGTAISLGIETPEMDRRPPGDRMRGQSRNPNGLDGPAIGPTQPGGQRGPGQRGRPEPLKLWTTLMLAN